MKGKILKQVSLAALLLTLCTFILACAQLNLPTNFYEDYARNIKPGMTISEIIAVHEERRDYEVNSEGISYEHITIEELGLDTLNYSLYFYDTRNNKISGNVEYTFDNDALSDAVWFMIFDDFNNTDVVDPCELYDFYVKEIVESSAIEGNYYSDDTRRVVWWSFDSGQNAYFLSCILEKLEDDNAYRIIVACVGKEYVNINYPAQWLEESSGAAE